MSEETASDHHDDIALRDAVRLVHKAMFKNEAVFADAHQRWLAKLDRLDASDRGLLQEWSAARNTLEEQNFQASQAFNWIVLHVLPEVRETGHKVVNRQQFEAAFGEKFPESIASSKAPSAARLGRPDALRYQTVVLLKRLYPGGVPSIKPASLVEQLQHEGLKVSADTVMRALKVMRNQNAK